MSDAARQIYWIQSLCSEMGIKTGPIDLCVDNQGAIFLASNPAQEHRSKHIDIKYHHIREAVNEGKVRLTFVPTNEQIADVLTKNLSFDKLKFFRKKLGLYLDEDKVDLNKTFNKAVAKNEFDHLIDQLLLHTLSG